MTHTSLPRRKWPRRRWFLLAAVLLGSVVAIVWRAGFLSRLSLAVQAYKFEAQNKFEFTGTSRSRGSARLACRRLAIVNHSEHPLLAEAGPQLQNRLRQLGYLGQVDYYPAGSAAKAGEMMPDVAITLDVEELAETRTLAALTLQTTIRLGVSSSPPDDNWRLENLLPIVRFQLTGRLHHTSTTTGIGRAGTDTSQRPRTWPNSSRKTLIKEFNEKYEKYGLLPELPEAFYPPYRPAPSLPLLDGYDVQKVHDYHGAFLRNATRWRLTADREPRSCGPT